MSGLQSWILGVVAGLVGIVALFFAAKDHGGQMYTIGLVVFLLVAAFEFWLIKRWFDAKEQH
jgi:ABC-type maltose transport system permease subunit